MALRNPLSLYTPGIPGRGAGTILRAPDFSNIAARMGKVKADQDALKKKEEADAIKAIADITDVKGTWWTKNNEEIASDMKSFNEEAIASFNKSDGKVDPVATSKLKIRANEISNKMKQSTIQQARYNSAWDMVTAASMKGTYDDADIQKARDEMVKWSDMSISDREKYPIEIYIPKEYSLNETIVKKIKPQLKPTSITSNFGTTQKDPVSGAFYADGVEKKGITLAEAQSGYRQEYVDSQKFRNAVLNQYQEFQKMYPDAATKGVEIDVVKDMGGRLAKEKETKTIGNIDEFRDYVLASAAQTYEEKPIRKSMNSGGTNVTVTTNQGTPSIPEGYYNIPVQKRIPDPDSNTGGTMLTDVMIQAPFKDKIILSDANKQEKGLTRRGSYGTIPGTAAELNMDNDGNTSWKPAETQGQYFIEFADAPELYIKNNSKTKGTPFDISATNKTGSTKRYVTFTVIPQADIEDVDAGKKKGQQRTLIVDPVKEKEWIKAHTLPGTWERIMGIPYDPNL